MFPRLPAFLAVAAGMTVSLPAFAEEAEKGMPQLNFANPLTYWQVIWMAVIFLVLYLLVRNWGLPQVANVVDARNASILADLESARQAKERADAAAAELAEVTRRSHAEAQAEIANAISIAKAEAAARAAELNAKLDAQLATAEAQIAASRAAAMGTLREVAADTARTILDRLLGETQSAQVDNAVGRVLAAHPQS